MNVDLKVKHTFSGLFIIKTVLSVFHINFSINVFYQNFFTFLLFFVQLLCLLNSIKIFLHISSMCLNDEVKQ